jgi:hypothetical protein
MTKDEYSLLFHKQQLNLVAFKRLMDCDEEVLRLVNSAIEAEREACAKVADHMASRCNDIRAAALESAAENIRARGQA